jgi:tetratricopeptide (TPR) repeat protein
MNLDPPYDLQKLKENGYNDKIGKIFLKTAVEDIKNQDFDKASNSLFIAYRFITCDCFIGDWFDPTTKLIIDSVDFKSNGAVGAESFVKAFVNFFYALKWIYDNKDIELPQDISDSLDEALAHIEYYILMQPGTDDGHYLKGRILVAQNKYTEALDSYYNALEINRAPRTLFRIGWLKEEKLKEDGLEDIFKALLNDRTSICCLIKLIVFGFPKGMTKHVVPQLAEGYEKDKNFPWKYGLSFSDQLEKDNYEGARYLSAVIGSAYIKMKSAEEGEIDYVEN